MENGPLFIVKRHNPMDYRLDAVPAHTSQTEQERKKKKKMMTKRRER